MPAMSTFGNVWIAVLNSRTDAVVVLAAEADLVLGRRQLLLELHDVLVRLQVGVVLDQREELAQGAGQEVLGLCGLAGVGGTGLLGVDGGAASLDDLRQGLLLEVHVALHRIDEVRDQVVASLELDADLVPRLVDHVPQPDQAVVGEDQEQDDDRDRDQQDDQPEWHSGCSSLGEWTSQMLAGAGHPHERSGKCEDGGARQGGDGSEWCDPSGSQRHRIVGRCDRPGGSAEGSRPRMGLASAP